MANEMVQGLLQNLLQPTQGPNPADIMAAISSRNPMASVAAMQAPQLSQMFGQQFRGLVGGLTGRPAPLTANEAYTAAVQQLSAQPDFMNSSASLAQLAKAASAVGRTQEAMQFSLLASQAREQEAEAQQQQAAQQTKDEQLSGMRLAQLQQLEAAIEAAPNPNAKRSLTSLRTSVLAGVYDGKDITPTLKTIGEMTAGQQPPNPPSSVQEYEYAKKQGFQGGFEDWISLGTQKNYSIGAPPAGYQYVGTGDKLRLEVIPGGPADNGMGPGDAAKAALVQTATDNFNEYKSFVFNYDDKGAVSGVNMTNIFNSNVPGGGTPFTEGRTLNVLIKDILEGKIRAESGAAVPASEIERLGERFRPSIFDNEATVKRKVALLGQFLDNVTSFMKADGSFDTGAATLAVDRALRTTDADLSGYSDQQLLQIIQGAQ